MHSGASVDNLKQRGGSENVSIPSHDSREIPQRVADRSAKSLKVLFVTNMYPDDSNPGYGAFVHHQAEHLRQAGHQVDVLRIGARHSRLKYLRSALDVFIRTRGTRYDVVHAHYGLSGVPALFRNHTPLVITLHGSDALLGRFQPLVSKAVCSLADAVIVVSKGILTRVPGEIIPCGIDMDVFQPRDRAAARARLGLPGNKKLVLFPFDPERKVKRYALAQAAVESLGDPDIQILAVGGKPNKEMPWYYSAADVMILSSASEGSPTSVKEALACNLPVVSTDVGDVHDIMDGIPGCEICEDDADSLSEGLKRVLNRPSYQEFASRPFMQRYDQTRIIAAILKVYEQAIHDHTTGNRRRLTRHPQPQKP